ncbi:MAG: sulfatase-like hydrolase/transferase [Trueperaceae bacterium]
MERPNIVLVLTDQQRWDSLGCYGNAFVSTPNVDALASRGTRLDRAFTPYPVCTPARASMWTGVLPHEHGVIDNVYRVDNALAERSSVTTTVFDLMREAGYECAYFGKWHLGEADPGYFDHYDGFNSQGGHWRDGRKDEVYRPEAQTDACVDWLRQREDDRPFLMVQSYYPPHNPFTAPTQFMDYYRDRRVPFPGYYAAVSALDSYFGRIVTALEEQGIRENTAIVYYSDHGETFNYRRDGVHKFVCHEEAIRVPLVVDWPGQEQVPNSDRMVGLEDLAPTLLDWADARIPDYFRGRSILPLLTGESVSWRDEYYVQNRTNVSNREQRCLRTDRWKLILSNDGDSELYDLTDDPEEELNLFETPRPDVHDQFKHLPSHDDTVLDLSRRLRRLAADLADDVGVRLADDTIRAKTEKNRSAAPEVR